MAVALAVYGVGLVWALLRTDAPPATRVAVALFWPLGPLAFVVTLSGLLLASLVAFPRFGAAAVVMAGVLWWVLS